MAKFNTTLQAHQTVVAVDHLHCDSNGAYSVAFVYDRKAQTVTTEVFADCHGGSYNDAVVDATREEIEAAAEAFRKHRPTKRVGGTLSYNGCEVTLSRSRKAPNKIPLQVINTYDRYFNGICYVSASVDVLHEGKVINVSHSCVNEVIKGPYPWWKPSI